MKGQVVTSPTGEQVELTDVGVQVLVDDDRVRVWDVTLPPRGQHPWHLHHNPYVVLSIEGAEGRMDWLDGSPPRFISEYRGGAVFRPVSPVHRLTNLSDHRYRNRLVELKDLGEHLEVPLDVGPGDQSSSGQPPGPALDDGREPVLLHDHVKVWKVDVPPVVGVELDLADVPHVLAALDGPDHEVAVVDGSAASLVNDTDETRSWLVLELTYLTDLEGLVIDTEGDDRG